MAKRSLRLIADTETCFYDLVGKHPELPVIELVADFCGTKVTRVQCWQRQEYFPRGGELLRLRCFLWLADYGVDELTKLSGPVRDLAFVIAFNLADALETERTLGYTSDIVKRPQPGSLWRVILRGEGFSPSRQEKLETLVETHKSAVTSGIEHWKGKIAEVIGAPETPKKVPAATIPSDTMLATAFARQVGSTTALGQMLTGANNASLLSATHGGADLRELIALLQRLLEAPK